MDPGRGRAAGDSPGKRTLGCRGGVVVRRYGRHATLAEHTTARGREAERLARDHLQARGLQMLAANYRCRYGELDLVMRDGAVLVVVEVRSRRSDRHGSPEASIGYRKARRLARSARCFLRDHPQFGGMMLRFDIVGILAAGERARVRWVPNALEFDGR